MSTGFEYWTDPNNPTEGFITWQSDRQQTARLGATAVGPDQDPAVGSGVGQRLIPQEPMVSTSPAFYSPARAFCLYLLRACELMPFLSQLS